MIWGGGGEETVYFCKNFNHRICWNCEIQLRHDAKKVFSANYAFKNLSRYLHNHKRHEKNKYFFYDHGSLLSVNIPVSTEITDVIQVGGSKNIVEDSRLNT